MTTTTRRKRTLSPEELAAGGAPHVAATAGTAPAGAIGGDQVLGAARNRAEMGQTAPTVVPDDYGEVTGTGIETTGDTGTLADDATPNENPALEPGATANAEPTDLDQMFEDYARGAFGEVDTSEEEAQMQAQQDRLLGRGLMDTRARMGEAGFAAGGLDVALENTARAEAAEQLGLDISGIRDREGEQRRAAIEGAMGLDLEKQSGARQDAILKAQMDALAKLLEEGGEAPPEGGDDSGGGLGGGLGGAAIGAASQALADETTPFGKGTGQSETATSGDPESYAERESHSDGDRFIENYTDPDGKTWSIYVTGSGERYRVPMGK